MGDISFKILQLKSKMFFKCFIKGLQTKIVYFGPGFKIFNKYLGLSWNTIKTSLL